MHLSAAIPGGLTPVTYGEIARDFLTFVARDGGIGRLLHFRCKIHGERPEGFVTSPLSSKMKDPDRGDWVLPLNGFQNGDGEKDKRVLRFSCKSVPFCWSSFPNIALEIYDLFHANLLMIRCWIFILSSVWIIHILLTIYIIVKLLLKTMQKITLQLGIPSKLCSPG